jgi:hypothetical protein
MSTTGRISSIVGNTFSFNHNGAYVCLQLNQTGTLHLMLVNVFYSQMLPLRRNSIARSNQPLPGGKIHLRRLCRTFYHQGLFIINATTIHRLTSIFHSGHSSLKHVIDSSHFQVSRLNLYCAWLTTHNGLTTPTLAGTSPNLNITSPLHTQSSTPAPSA